MKDNSTSTRRRFLKGGALLAAPIAAASIGAVALADDGLSGDRLQARVTRLEDEAAIRDLHRSWLRRINAGQCAAQLDPQLAPQPNGVVRRISAHLAGAPDSIEIAADGQSAVGHFDSAVELETPLARDSTLAQMAYVQGNGTVRRTEHRLLIVSYTKTGGAWAMGRVGLRSL